MTGRVWQQQNGKTSLVFFDAVVMIGTSPVNGIIISNRLVVVEAPSFSSLSEPLVFKQVTKPLFMCSLLFCSRLTDLFLLLFHC